MIDFQTIVNIRGYTGIIVRYDIPVFGYDSDEWRADVTLRDLSPYGNEISLEGVKQSEVHTCIRPR